VKFATVTLTYNRLAALQRCIDSIRATGGADMIVVVDNHSTDGTAEWLKQQTDILSVRTPENRGVIARNVGFDLLQRPIACDKIDTVVQIDDDVVMCAGWQGVLETTFADRHILATGQAGGYFGDFSSLTSQSLQPGTPVDTLTGFCWAIHASVLTQYIGGGHMIGWECVRYDEEFGMRWHEETDLQCLIRYLWQSEKCHDRFVTCSPIAIHNSLAGDVDWPLHNRNLERLKSKWGPESKTPLKSEAHIRREPCHCMYCDPAAYQKWREEQAAKYNTTPDKIMFSDLMNGANTANVRRTPFSDDT
jgi:glycosyltransferase involved in cell wall biosynthesis